MQAYIEKDTIKLSFPYNKKKVAFCQAMAMKWSKITRRWSVKNNYMNRCCINRFQPGLLPPEPSRGAKELVVPSYLMDHQGIALRRAARQDRRGKFHDTGCHAKGTKILMADGHIKNVENVMVGDYLMGETGFRKVLSLCRGFETMYRVVPVKGSSFIVNASHILALHTWKRRYIRGSSKDGCQYEWYPCNENISVRDFVNKSRSYKDRSKLRRAEVSEFKQTGSEQTLTIRPYHLGLFLGDGSMQRTPAIHNRYDSIIKSVVEIANQFDLHIRTQIKDGTNTVSHYLTNGNTGGKHNSLADEFAKLNLRVHCRDKFIPHCYKTAKYSDRLELLAGLIDTDGHLSNGNVYEYLSASKKLADDMMFVCRSVGLCVTQNERIVKNVTYYRLCISGNIDKISCRRKKKQATPRKQKKRSHVTGFRIEKFFPDNFYGFTLDGDHLYLTGDFIVHHNTGKTITAIEIFRHHRVKTLVICPLSIIEGAWFEELNNPLAGVKESTPEVEEARRQYREIEASNLWAAKKKSIGAFNKALEKDLCLINYESFRTIDKKLSGAGFDMVILDESARIRTFKRGNTADKVIEFCDNVQYVYELSGVPAPNSMLEYWTQIRILDPLLWSKSYYKFRTKYFNPKGYGGYTWVVKEEFEKKLIEDIKTVAEYVDKEDVLDLPGTVESKRIFQLSKEEMAHYKNIKNDLVTILDGGEKISSPSAVTALMKLRQISSGFILNTTVEEINGKIKKKKEVFKLGNSKLNELLPLLEDLGAKQVLIWTEFQEEANIISKALSKKRWTWGILNGTIPEKQKQVTLRAFKGGDLQYAICHPKSVGFGHTLVNCTEGVYYSNSHSYDNSKQSKDRIYRKGQEEICFYYYLLAADTLDPVILKAVLRKEDTSMAILEHLKSGK